MAQQQQQRLQHEAVWRLLLSELWEQPETSVLCKLLCCSRAMEELVYSTCAGRLCLIFCADPTRRTHMQGNSLAQSCRWPSNLAFCRWLAKHARLLQTMHVLTSWVLTDQDSQFQQYVTEDVLAAGLAAAATHQHSASGGPRTRRAAAADSAAFAAAREAAAAGPAGSIQGQQQGLPLQSLRCFIHSDGSLLCSLAGSTQLTHLRLSLRKGATPAAGSRQALASLTGLKQLEISIGCGMFQDDSHQPRDLAVYHHLAPALKHLTSLTKLCAPGFILKPQQLPSSLLEVVASRLPGVALKWQGMQGVTRLELGVVAREEHLQEGDVLPPRLQHLQLYLSDSQVGSPSLLPVRQLGHLTELELKMKDTVFPQQVQQLQGMSQLRALKIPCSYIDDGHGLLQMGQVLCAEQLPLTSFTVWWSQFSAKTIQPWKHLTRLELSDVTLPHADEIRQLGVQLQGLTALQVLIMCRWRVVGYLSYVPGVIVPANGPRPADFEPLLRVVPQLRALRELCVHNVPFHAAGRCLSAATQLSKLTLWGDCVDDTMGDALQQALHSTIVDIWPRK